MSIIDKFKQIISNNKKNAILTVENLVKNQGSSEQLEIHLSSNNAPLTSKEVTIHLNGVDYKRTTNADGVAKLNINLPVGVYDAHISFEDDEYNKVSSFCEIIVKGESTCQGVSIVKNLSQSSQYRVSAYNSIGELLDGDFDITVNGVTYTKTSNDGVAKLNINLSVGSYEINSTFKGNKLYNSSSCKNTVTVNSDPVQNTTVNKTSTTPTLKPYLTNTGADGMGQGTAYYCGCNSLQQCFYRLTGILVKESTLAKVCGTTTSGTGHSGLETAVAWFNKTYNKNIHITWKNFSDLGSTETERWNKLQYYINTGAVFIHLAYQNGGATYSSKNKSYGHYEVPKQVNANNLTILNSLGSKCNAPAYCGFIQTRSKSVELAYIKGISQKSVAILTNGG